MTLGGKERYEQLLSELRSEFPGFRLIQKKDSTFHKLIHEALRIVTLGQMRCYLDGYQTTLGQRVYVTADWESRSYDSRTIVLRHERVHIRQF